MLKTGHFGKLFTVGIYYALKNFNLTYSFYLSLRTTNIPVYF